MLGRLARCRRPDVRLTCTWFEHGQFIRGRAGSADDGVFFDQGNPLPIEQKLEAFDPDSPGEEFVMELCRPFIGCRLDEFDAWDLQMEHFVKTG